jgi:hypothetical protein
MAEQPKTRVTASVRRALEAQRRQQQEEVFNQNRDQEWLQLWARVLQLELLLRDTPEVREDNSWAFSWKANVQDEAIVFDRFTLSRTCISFVEAEELREQLDSGFDCYNRHCEEVERERREREERETQRQAALAKLTPEDRKVLGV